MSKLMGWIIARSTRTRLNFPVWLVCLEPKSVKTVRMGREIDDVDSGAMAANRLGFPPPSPPCEPALAAISTRVGGLRKLRMGEDQRVTITCSKGGSGLPLR